MRLIPNIITLGRLVAVPLTVYFILIGELEVAFWLFVAAGVSDAIDGAIARLCDARTVFGAFLDPLADKALLVSVYLSLARDGLLPLWLVILVVFRDLLIVGGVLLSYTLRQPVTMRPLVVSKLNTLAQLMLAALVLAINGPGLPGFDQPPVLFGHSLAGLLEGVVAVTTVLSGAGYVLRCDLLFGGGGRT
jgi:cardiolipin synthase